jgi:sec-independent protein translocase protein TatB
MKRPPALPLRARTTGAPELAFAMFDIGFSEILLIFGLALVVLGPDKLPQVARTIGRWAGRARAMARQFRDQLEAETDNFKVDLNPTPPTAAPPPAPAAPPATTTTSQAAPDTATPPATTTALQPAPDTATPPASTTTLQPTPDTATPPASTTTLQPTPDTATHDRRE